MHSDGSCLFCRIIAGSEPVFDVFEDECSLAFLDHRPLFPGHLLLVPKSHCELLTDLSDALTGTFFRNVKHLSRVVEIGMKAEGSFVAINNRVSQSVPHLHVHIVPRRRKDGLKGFFWPRNPYRDDQHRREVQARLKSVLTS